MGRTVVNTKVKIALKVRVTASAAAQADVCPNGVSHPAMRTETVTWIGRKTSKESRTSAGHTVAAAKKKAAEWAFGAAVVAAARKAERTGAQRAGTAALAAARLASATYPPPPTEEQIAAWKPLVTVETIKAVNVARAKAGVQPLSSMQVLTDNAGIWAQFMSGLFAPAHSPQANQVPASLSACTETLGIVEIVSMVYVDQDDFTQRGAELVAADIVDRWLDNAPQRNALLDTNPSRAGVGVGVTIDDGLGGFRIGHAPVPRYVPATSLIELHRFVHSLLQGDRSRSALVDVATVAKRYDNDEQSVVLHGVDDAVATDADTECIAAAERLCAGWSGVGSQECDRPPDACLVLVIDALQCAQGSWPNLNLIGH